MKTKLELKQAGFVAVPWQKPGELFSYLFFCFLFILISWYFWAYLKNPGWLGGMMLFGTVFVMFLYFIFSFYSKRKKLFSVLAKSFVEKEDLLIYDIENNKLDVTNVRSLLINFNWLLINTIHKKNDLKKVYKKLVKLNVTHVAIRPSSRNPQEGANWYNDKFVGEELESLAQQIKATNHRFCRLKILFKRCWQL